jgi:hypothetical protein
MSSSVASFDIALTREAKSGAAIMRYRSKRNPSLQLFGRYVADDRFGRQSERAEPVFIPRADRKSCAVYECKPSTSTTIFQFLCSIATTEFRKVRCYRGEN